LKLVDGLVYLTADEMRLMDEETIGGFSIDVLSLMENAGVCVAEAARRRLGGDVRGKSIACLAGRGNNGGDGFVASRHLHDWGAEVTVILSGDREGITGIPAKQLLPLERTGVPVLAADSPLSGYSLLIDALLGYSAKGDPREPMASLIRRANTSGVKILALDLPSGMDPTTGEPGNPCVEATATITLGLPKVGFLNPRAKKYLGSLSVADISIPPEVYSKHSQPPGLFERDRIVSIW
jgi:NAD(P)H-hydrate epimerase